MKAKIEQREPSGILDYFALAFTTWGVGYIPGAPGTYGSAIGVAIYLGVDGIVGWANTLKPFYDQIAPDLIAWVHAGFGVILISFCLVGIWSSSRAIALLGNSDPSEATVDEVMGQLITFLFIPFGLSWPFIFAGFLLFRLFDIWKPYPIDDLQVLPGGLGVCADDIVAGVYAGVCLALGYAVYLAL